MARKPYIPPVIDIMGSSPGSGATEGEGSGQGPVNGTTASFSAWKMAVQNANMDVDMSYAGYVDWMIKNGYAAYIQPDDSELQ